MPTYTFPTPTVEIPRASMLIDTNVLVSRFLPGDEREEDATAFLELMREQLITPILPVPVIVETWGMLCGRSKSFDSAIRFVTWFNDPGNALLLPQHCERFGQVEQVAAMLRVDFVDALLVHLADELSEKCGLRPPLKIATFDTRDFTKRLIGLEGVRLRVHDLNSNDELDIGGLVGL